MTEELKDKKKKRRIGWWILFGVVVVAGAIIGWRVLRNQREMNQLMANIETEPFQRQTLNANIFGTGTVEPRQSAVLTWSAGGNVGEVLVSVGDEVIEGQLLMSLDPDAVSIDIKQAEIDLINTQNALDDLNENLESDLAQAELDLLNAQEELDDMETNRTIMNYQRCSDDRIEELEFVLDNAEEFYDRFSNSYTFQAVNTAQADLNYCRSDYSDREIAEAELEVSLAEVKVADLQERFDILSEGPDPDQLTILETQLDIAQSRLDSVLLEAPFDGIVTVLPVKHGDVVQVGMQAVQIDDLSEIHLDVQISEIDIPFVEIGQPVELVFDAYFEDTFTGDVAEIAPVGQNIQGIVEYTVRINMKDADERIKPGMTAAVNIVVDEKEDVLVLPNDAIVNIDGEDHVFVSRNGSYEDVLLTLGSYSDYYSEVIEADIEEGELVVLNPPPEITGELPFGGGPFGGPFGGPGN